MKKNSGITLIALIITVIVMLILAGVVIATVVNEDGLFSKIRQAVETYYNASQNEENTIYGLFTRIDMEQTEGVTDIKIKKVDETRILLDNGTIKNTESLANSWGGSIDLLSRINELQAYNVVERNNYFNNIRIKNFINNVLVEDENGDYIPLDNEGIRFMELTGKKVRYFSFIGTTYYVIDTDGILWSWGTNTNGILGNGTNESISTPQPVNGIDKKVASLTILSSRIFALDEEGSLWSWGSGIKNYLGYFSESDQLTPKKITEIDKKVVEIGKRRHNSNMYAIDEDGCFWMWGDIPITKFDEITGKVIKYNDTTTEDTNYILDEDGNIWSWGSENEYGNLGYTGISSTPKKINIGKKIVDYTANWWGGWNLYALDEDGVVWTWGRNRYGELGIGNKNQQNSPQKMNIDKKVVKIFPSGYYFCVLLDEEGNLWYCGNSNNSGNGVLSSTIPTKLQGNDSKIVDILSITYSTIYAIDENGELWIYGTDVQFVENIEDAVEDTTSLKTTFRKIDLFGAKPVKKSYINGTEFILDDHGNVWSWGNPSFGYIGREGVDDNTENIAQKIYFGENKILDLRFLSNSYAKVFAIDASGKLWTWGRYSYTLTNSMYNYYKPYCVNDEYKKAQNHNIVDFCKDYVLTDKGEVLYMPYYDENFTCTSQNSNYRKLVYDYKQVCVIDTNGVMYDVNGNILYNDKEYEDCYNGIFLDKLGNVYEAVYDGSSYEMVRKEIGAKVESIKGSIKYSSTKRFALDENGELWYWTASTEPVKLDIGKKIIDFISDGTILGIIDEDKNVWYTSSSLNSLTNLYENPESILYNKKIDQIYYIYINNKKVRIAFDSENIYKF